MGEHTALPWDFRDGFILANGEALRLVGVQIPMCVGPQRREAIANARLLATAVNTQPAVADLVKALETVRHQWAGHSDQCALVLSHYKGKCDCDWPMIARQCDDALSRFRALANRSAS